ncbi:MAG: RDD family protein [Dehalococcoidia bacterium]|nr:RDD family protein [Dehalococcoidia bacterium]
MATLAPAATNVCRACGRPLQPGLFCPYDGVFILDPQGTTVMASRISRLGASIVNAILIVLTLGIGWIIWWFIVAPRGQNPGKAVVGLRVIRADGRAVSTGWMFVRGLLTFVGGLIPLYLDDLWLLWDQNAQTLHDKMAATVVVRAQGSEHIVLRGSVGELPAGYTPPPAFAPPVSFPATAEPARSTPAAMPPGDSPAEALRRLEDLKSRGLITDEEYAVKRATIVDRL